MAENFTRNALENFLGLLDSNRENAGVKYEHLRQRLIKFFEWRNCEMAEELTDDVFDRILKKIAEGQEIQNVSAYSASVAQFVFKEYLRTNKIQHQLIENAPEIQQIKAKEFEEEDVAVEKRRRCFEQCLDKFSAEERRFIIAYYQTDDRTMINSRKKLADELNVSLNTIRIKAFRLKAKLEKCTLDCCM